MTSYVNKPALFVLLAIAIVLGAVFWHRYQTAETARLSSQESKSNDLASRNEGRSSAQPSDKQLSASDPTQRETRRPSGRLIHPEHAAATREPLPGTNDSNSALRPWVSDYTIKIDRLEAELRQREKGLSPGLSLEQVLQVMGEPVAIHTPGDPREINAAAQLPAWRREASTPSEAKYHEALRLAYQGRSPAWYRGDQTPFAKLNLLGHPVEFSYSSNPKAYRTMPFGSSPYKVLMLVIDERGTLDRWEGQTVSGQWD